jgi:hypothetical protein
MNFLDERSTRTMASGAICTSFEYFSLRSSSLPVALESEEAMSLNASPSSPSSSSDGITTR